MKLKTPAEAKAEFRRKGISVAAWARKHNFTPSMVHDILNGHRSAYLRGKCHRAAVLLGLKDGEIVE